MNTHDSGEKPIRGTREWAVAEINCSIGCPHGCRYCYARYDQVERRGVVLPWQWEECRILEDELLKKQPLYSGQVMFPSAHDIIRENLEASVTILKNLLDAGNRVLVVSKPHLPCIERLCSELSSARKQLLFRFTITARDRKTLEIWEPNAPLYKERKECLQLAFDEGFATSVSVEPMLDVKDVEGMVYELLPYITHSIWLGKMNRIDRRVVCESRQLKREVERIKKGQTDEQLLFLYNKLKTIPMVRWKESVKKAVGLELAMEPGLDI